MQYRNRFATIEKFEGNWELYNDVTGLFVRECDTYDEARTAMVEMAQYYSAIEGGRNGY